VIREAQNQPPQASAGATALRRRLIPAQGPVELGPFPMFPSPLSSPKDTKVILRNDREAGRQQRALLNPITLRGGSWIELNGVTLEDALEVVSFKTKTFLASSVTPNTIFVAQDNLPSGKSWNKTSQTFYLSNLPSPRIAGRGHMPCDILEVSRLQQLPLAGRDRGERARPTRWRWLRS